MDHKTWTSVLLLDQIQRGLTSRVRRGMWKACDFGYGSGQLKPGARKFPFTWVSAWVPIFDPHPYVSGG